MPKAGIAVGQLSSFLKILDALNIGSDIDPGSILEVISNAPARGDPGCSASPAGTPMQSRLPTTKDQSGLILRPPDA
jgi:hypothetical protein